MKPALKSSLLTLALGFTLAASAQDAQDDVPRGWHLKDFQKDGYYGISLDKAYEFLKNKKNNTVIVAVIDSGIDTTHEDLKTVLWTNAKEIPGNGVDDDKNGYIDDVHGWNFLGGKDGRNVEEDSYEAARVYHQYKLRFGKITDPTALSAEDRKSYNMWKKAEQQVVGEGKTNGLELLVMRRSYMAMTASDSLLRKAIGKETFTGKELEAYTPATEELKRAKSTFLYFFTVNNIMDVTNTSFLGDFKTYLDSEEKKAEAAEKAPRDYRGEIVKDNYHDLNDRYYGNNDIMAGTPLHGTHVSGIIAAVRNNGKGVDGIANNVRIMSLRAVPDGDEHDKDIALAIRYAVDNGAKVINMSFGKGFSPEKNWVDDAVQYAEEKGVLLVHAAGNNSDNSDSTDNFPNPSNINNGKRASNWLTVGASGDPKAGGLVAYFSNFGKNEVDVFAPGVKIYSTVPTKNQYLNEDGTSMASPVVAGVAALILSYYPDLTPHQVKTIIENSSVKPTVQFKGPGEEGTNVKLSDISRSGGIVNAFEAIKLADSISKANGKKPQKR
ncbi:S8 family peptidase [Paraflavisolibacter sp. H34]|uniref:S8 family peptidase n=1 Tax=Huijunlia imazamoxiresistens TaxID=3127457 RepID=UPI003017B002